MTFKKAASYLGQATLLLLICLFFLWDAIPPAACNNENSKLYSPAQMYEHAMASRGIWKDQQQAACWLLQSARAGNTDAYTSVGLNYEMGRGVDKNITKAIKWYKRAIDAGRSGGAYRMAILYREGRGVPVDSQLAERHVKLQKKLKITEPEHDFGSNIDRKLKSMYQAITHADQHLARVFQHVLN